MDVYPRRSEDHCGPVMIEEQARDPSRPSEAEEHARCEQGKEDTETRPAPQKESAPPAKQSEPRRTEPEPG